MGKVWKLLANWESHQSHCKFRSVSDFRDRPDWTMSSCCCCCCYKDEDETGADYEVYMVEDGDELQNMGVRRTLELLRRLMSQNGRP
ncbi:unnamed protein product [Echinostoma caproni]|uniref:YkgJ family cysteine cluster protein n=1 Tax=Echinostoma caproni TaxID=27848 RepID=A0A183AXW5_9TREM|nr:unnamed protein product [Echinostoma caproni]